MHSAKTDALLYLLVGLLQRMESHEPGLLQELLDEVIADESRLHIASRQVGNRAHLEAVYTEAREILEQALNQPTR